MLKILYVDADIAILACIIFPMIFLFGVILSVYFESPRSLFYFLKFIQIGTFAILLFAAYASRAYTTDSTDTTDIIRQLKESKINISNADAEKISDNLYEHDKYTFTTTSGQILYFHMLNKTRKGIHVTATYKVDVDKKE